jgi:hypothetical protein
MNNNNTTNNIDIKIKYVHRLLNKLCSIKNQGLLSNNLYNSYALKLLHNSHTFKKQDVLEDAVLINTIADKLLIETVFINLFNKAPKDGWCEHLHYKILSVPKANFLKGLTIEEHQVMVKIFYLIFERLYYQDAYNNYDSEYSYSTFYATNNEQLKSDIKGRFQGDIEHIIQIELCNQHIPFSLLQSKLSGSLGCCNRTYNILYELLEVKEGFINFSSLVRSNDCLLFNTDTTYLLNIFYNILLLRLDIQALKLWKTTYDLGKSQTLNPASDKLIRQLKDYQREPLKYTTEIKRLEEQRLITNTLYSGSEYRRFHYVRFGPEFLMGLSGFKQKDIKLLVKNITRFYKEQFDLTVTLKVTDMTDISYVECFNYKLSYGFMQKNGKTVRQVSFDPLGLFTSDNN